MLLLLCVRCPPLLPHFSFNKINAICNLNSLRPLGPYLSAALFSLLFELLLIYSAFSTTEYYEWMSFFSNQHLWWWLAPPHQWGDSARLGEYLCCINKIVFHIHSLTLFRPSQHSSHWFFFCIFYFQFILYTHRNRKIFSLFRRISQWFFIFILLMPKFKARTKMPLNFYRENNLYLV